MHDSPRLFLGDQINPVALQFRQRLQHAERKGRVNRQRHVRTDQRVATKQGHVPGCSRSDHRTVMTRWIVQPQRADVGNRTVKSRAQPPVYSSQRWYGGQPSLVASRGVGQARMVVTLLDPFIAEGHR